MLDGFNPVNEPDCVPAEYVELLDNTVALQGDPPATQINWNRAGGFPTVALSFQVVVQVGRLTVPAAGAPGVEGATSEAINDCGGAGVMDQLVDITALASGLLESGTVTRRTSSELLSYPSQAPLASVLYIA